MSLYQQGRYISRGEAAWRIFGFPIHDRYPSVQRLAVHLENGQRMYFTEENYRQQIECPRNTTLTAFFQLCINDQFAANLLYHEVPSYYRWHQNQWQRRKAGSRVADHPEIYKSDVIGRVYTVNPKHSECYFLRLLLHEVRGPTSFQHLKTVAGAVCESYREACLRLGLLEDDANWNATLTEAAVSKSAGQLRNLFAIMLCNCSISAPVQLWDKHKNTLCEDITFRHDLSSPNDEITNECLILLEDKLLSLGGVSLQDYGLPTPSRPIIAGAVTDHVDHDIKTMLDLSMQMCIDMNQNFCLNRIMCIRKSSKV